MVWKFFGKAQFPHSFGRIARNYAETVPFHKISTSWNYVKLRYLTQWINVQKMKLSPKFTQSYALWKITAFGSSLTSLAIEHFW